MITVGDAFKALNTLIEYCGQDKTTKGYYDDKNCNEVCPFYLEEEGLCLFEATWPLMYTKDELDIIYKEYKQKHETY